jgi:hypothetical protein
MKMQLLRKDIQGQLPIEFLLVFGFILMLLIPLVLNLSNVNELNHAMSACRAGALQGALSDGLAVYPDDAYKGYEMEHHRLINPSEVKITKIEYFNQGFNPSYQKTKIQLRIHATASSITNKSDRNCLGDRINFHARKKICESFHTENLTNSIFNPAFSDKYVFTTTDVRWE